MRAALDDDLDTPGALRALDDEASAGRPVADGARCWASTCSGATLVARRLGVLTIVAVEATFEHLDCGDGPTHVAG